MVTGDEALILPTLGRTDHDHTAAGPQSVSVEDSQGAVHLSKGNLIPPAPELKSEIGIVCGLAQAVVPDVGQIPWADFADDYSLIRQRIGRVADGYENYEARLRDGDGA